MRQCSIFLLTYKERIDSKNRIIPVDFRNILEYKTSREVYAYSLFINECIEGAAFERRWVTKIFLDRMGAYF